MRMMTWLSVAALFAVAPACKNNDNGSVTGQRNNGQMSDQVKTPRESARNSPARPDTALPTQGAQGSESATAANSESSENSGSAANASGQEVSGKLAQASDTQLRIDSLQQPLKIDSSTQITLDGQPTSAAQLQPGSEVRASYRPDGTAIKVDAKSAQK